jgi:hypothetical protein
MLQRTLVKILQGQLLFLLMQEGTTILTISYKQPIQQALQR